MMNRPLNRSSGYYNQYNVQDLDRFLTEINFETGNITGKKLYLYVKNTSQSKLRDAGFTITRSKDKADIIVIDNFMDYFNEWYITHQNVYQSYSLQGVEELFTEMQADFDAGKTYKYLYSKDLYKYLYKYDGNQELFTNIEELLKSKDYDNAKIAMEFMANANWTNNEIYLQEIFNNYYSNVIRGNSFKNSISFRGFLESLDFKYDQIYFQSATDYRELCKTQEHHDWVFKKYEDEFKKDVANLAESYKMKITNFTYEIDKTIV